MIQRDEYLQLALFSISSVATAVKTKWNHLHNLYHDLWKHLNLDINLPRDQNFKSKEKAEDICTVSQSNVFPGEKSTVENKAA